MLHVKKNERNERNRRVFIALALDFHPPQWAPVKNEGLLNGAPFPLAHVHANTYTHAHPMDKTSSNLLASCAAAMPCQAMRPCLDKARHRHRRPLQLGGVTASSRRSRCHCLCRQAGRRHMGAVCNRWGGGAMSQKRNKSQKPR